MDLADFAAFQRCFGIDPVSPECWNLDLDDNGVIDLDDFEAFHFAFTGPG